VFFWLPSFFVRSYHLNSLNASLFFGGVLLIGGLAGIWAGGWLGDRFGHSQHSQYARIPAIAFVATVPFYILAIGLLSDTLQAQFGDDSLRYSILAGTGFYIIASVLFFLAARWLEQDWED